MRTSFGTNQNKPFELLDFSGGLNSNTPEFLVPSNQAIDLQNLTLLPAGFMKRLGNVAFNSSAMVSSSTAIVGAAYMKYDSGVEFLNAVAGTKFFTSSSITGTMADKTGALTITGGQNNLWTGVSYNNLQIWFGGAPDAPFTHDGSGSDAAALGGSPPSARTAFVANNRVFALSTAGNPSRIYWSIIGDPSDWAGAGSGNADIAKSDGEALLNGILIDTDTALLFKNSSTHLMPLTKAPFPTYQLQKGIGAAGQNAMVNVNGTIFFVTPSLRMLSTIDGRNFQPYPTDIDDIWDSINPTRVSFISGIYYPTLNQIHWFVSTGSSSTNNLCIIWDVTRKAWLKNPTGFKANVACLVRNKRLFTGHYNGKIFEQNRAATYFDASETGAGTIDGYWTTPWGKAGSLSDIVHPQWIDCAYLTQNSGTISVSYGFDFAGDVVTESLSLSSNGDLWDTGLWDTALWGGQTSVAQRVFVSGRGNVFNMRFRHTGVTEGFIFQGATIQLRDGRARKVLQGI